MKPGDKRPGEGFRDYFRRARVDPAVRGRLLATARFARALCGALMVLFAVLAIWELGHGLRRAGAWPAVACALGVGASWFARGKFGERVAALQAGMPRWQRAEPEG